MTGHLSDKKVALIGYPGVGKGIYAKFFSKKFYIPAISTGEFLREEIKKRTKVGVAASLYVNQGKLVPDNLVIDVLKKKLSTVKSGYLIDGFPRTLAQVYELKSVTSIDNVLFLNAPYEIFSDRLAGRRKCQCCGQSYHIKYFPPKIEDKCDECGGFLHQREDDKPEAVQMRLIEFNKKTSFVVDYFKKKTSL